jgi:hypothetical protein
MNRRSFFTSLLAAPAAAWAMLRPKAVESSGLRPPIAGLDDLKPWWPTGEPVYRCFNCRRWTAASKWLPGGVGSSQLQRGGIHHEATIHLCDACIEAIQHCVTCGRRLVRGDFKLRVSPQSEGMAFTAWAAIAPTLEGTMNPAWNQIGARPTNRDLIVADCPPCAGARSFIMPARRMVVRLASGKILG